MDKALAYLAFYGKLRGVTPTNIDTLAFYFEPKDEASRSVLSYAIGRDCG